MAERSDDPDRVTRALTAVLRDQVEGPVAGLVGMIDMLAEDAVAAGLTSYSDDLARMRAAGKRLSELVSGILQRTNTGAPDVAATSGQLRHDLRTPITAILGYGELMAEEARERGDSRLEQALADTLDATGRLLKDIDKLVAVSNADGVAAAGGDLVQAVPDVLRKAVRIATQLSRHEAAFDTGLTGRILVVDDNPSMRDLVSRRLTRDGHHVATCGGGHDALDMTAEGAFDLVLLDLMMPGIDGLEVLKRLKARAGTRALPVIVISALDEIDAAVRCIESGADDFLTKPLNETLLRARIGSSLERKFLRDRDQATARQLRSEQERSETLLHNVLPAGIVKRLRRGETVIADHFDEATVLFCDLVGFTALAARLAPAETLDLLNRIFSEFDRLAAEHGLEKIKTIGDAYMVVGGIPDPVVDHARRVVAMACRMPAIVASARGTEALDVRVGIDTGPAVAGIIGKQKFFYDVWGDTVNTASRLEASCEPGRIHVSAATRDLTSAHFSFVARPPIEIRGKGILHTFYVDQP